MSTCSAIRIPGPGGPGGPGGTNGTNGVNAYSLVAAAFAIPAQQATVLVTLTDPPGNRWMALGQIVVVQAAGTGFTQVGYYRVQSKTSTNQVTLLNLRNDATGVYADNLVAGVVGVGLSISPGGSQGPTGQTGTPGGGAPDDATYILQTADASLPNAQNLAVLPTGFLHSTTAIGIIQIIPEGIGDGYSAINDGALTPGDAIFATAIGVESQAAATARTSLGLGTIAVQNANNVTITGGSITGVTLPIPAGLPYQIAILQHQEATTVNAGNFASGAWQDVVVNTEVVDTGNNVTLAGNIATLTPGWWRIGWRVPGRAVDKFQSRLWNVSTAAVIGYGSNEMAPASDGAQSYSQGEARFQVSAGQQIKLQARCQTTNATGFGEANSFGGTEVYTSIILAKESS